jgi:RecB family exonuclease
MTHARIVVPSDRHVERLACAGVVAETRARLCDRLYVALAPEVRLASPAEVRLTLRAALARTPAGARAADVDAAIGELRAGAVDPEDLATTGRAGGLGATMRALDDALRARGAIDPRRAPLVLARALRAADPREVVAALGSNHVVARGIVAWDMADLAWWRALDDSLSRARGSATIELPSIDRRLDADRDRTPLEVVHDEIARALDAPPHVDSIEAPLGDLSFQGALGEGVHRVEVRSAVDAHGQARAAVDAVLRALEAGANVERIAVAAPTGSPDVVSPVVELLDAAGIATSAASSARGSGLAACALDALSVAAHGMRRESVAALLRSPYVRLAEGPKTSRALARALEETATERGHDTVTSLEATARAWPESESYDVVPLSRRVGEILSLGAEARTISEQVGATRAMWSALGLEPRVDGVAAAALARDGAPRSLARADVRACAKDARAWNVIAATLDALARVPSPRISSDELRAEIESALDADAVGEGERDAAAVRILPIEALAGEPLDLLVLLDVNEGGLGSPPSRTTLLSGVVVTGDPSRTSLASAPLRAARALAELAAAASGARHVVVCHRDRARDGTLLAPGRLATWLVESGVAHARWSAAPLAGRPLSGGEARLDAVASGSGLAPDASRRAAIEHAREQLFERPGAAPTDVCGVVLLDDARATALRHATGGDERPLAVTSLEQIAQCPFKGFASVVLRARGDAMLGEAPEARELGTLVHRALAAAFVATDAMWKRRPRDREEILGRALSAADIVLGEGDPESALRRLARLRARDDVVAVLEWSLADETWSFARAEQAFGASSRASWPPLVLDDGVTRVALRGSIDRVDADVSGRAIRAIDYKTSEAAATSAAKSLGETTFQAPVYASAAAQALHATATDALYLPTNGRALRPGYTRSDRATGTWNHAIEDVGGRTRAEARALDVVRELRSGYVAPRPADASVCASCSFDGACRKPRFAIARTEDDEASE